MMSENQTNSDHSYHNEQDFLAAWRRFRATPPEAHAERMTIYRRLRASPFALDGTDRAQPAHRTSRLRHLGALVLVTEKLATRSRFSGALTDRRGIAISAGSLSFAAFNGRAAVTRDVTSDLARLTVYWAGKGYLTVRLAKPGFFTSGVH